MNLILTKNAGTGIYPMPALYFAIF